MVKMNFTNNQTAFEYAIYMMFGSYFDKTSCKNPLLEKKMHVQYQEQKEQKQIEFENICIRFMEKELLPNTPKKFWEQKVEVKFCPTKWDGIQDIQFHGSEYVLRVRGIYRGKHKTDIHYGVWQKDAKPHNVL